MTGAEKGATVNQGKEDGVPDVPVLSPSVDGPDFRGLAIIALCAVLVLAIAFLLALKVEHWVDRASDGFPSWQRQLDRPSKVVSASRPRTIPLRDPAKANMPAVGNPGLAFSQDNYPAEALRRGEEGRVVTMLLIDATGAVASCSVTKSSGSRLLDETTCRIARGRVRYEPARDAAGNAIASRTVLPVRWAISQ